MRKTCPFQRLLLMAIICKSITVGAQSTAILSSYYIYDSIKVTVDKPKSFNNALETIITFFALPNGNTTAYTIGKKFKEGDNFHFDGQHIGAQTKFIRERLKDKNFVVVYMENKYLSWPLWKQKSPGFRELLPHLVDSIRQSIDGKKKWVYLNGHSGGGSFIFGYLAGVAQIPSYVQRISFLDSDYGYDSSYYPKIKSWLRHEKKAAWNVFAYNDSLVIYNGKPLVSPTGGTWYRSRLMMRDMQEDFSFNKTRDDSLVFYKTKDERVQFFFRTNPEGKIFHTQQVGQNGFIHSVLCGTKYDTKGYVYYGERVYNEFLE